FGKDDAELASLALRTGTVNYTPDDLLAPEPQLGTELSVSVGGRALGSVVTPQLLPHVQMLPVPVADPFLMLDAVARAGRDESAIELRPSMNKSLGEAAYETNCVGNLFQTNKGNPSQCCQLSAAYTAI